MPDNDYAEIPTVIWMRDPVGPVQRRGPRPSHSRDDITRAAVAIADERGLAEVSIRAVAKEIGAGAASLYRYIDSKVDLYDLMVDMVVAEFRLPAEPAGDWRSDLRTIAQHTRVVHRRHPWAFRLFSEASWGPGIQTYMEFFLAALAPTGLELREQTEFIALFNSTVATFASHEQRGDHPGDPRLAQARVLHLRQIAENPELPRLSEVVGQMLTAEQPDLDEIFEHSISRLINSIGVTGR